MSQPTTTDPHVFSIEQSHVHGHVNDYDPEPVPPSVHTRVTIGDPEHTRTTQDGDVRITL